MRDHTIKKPVPGSLTVAAARDLPLVLLVVPTGAKEIQFTSDQARNIARLLIERANEIDNRRDSLQVEMRHGTA